MKIIPYQHMVQYYETDQMAIVHHSNYIRWFEEARVDWFTQLGVPYSDIEACGIQIPVVSCEAKYHLPVRYGGKVLVFVKRDLFNGARLSLSYEVRSSDAAVLFCTGKTEHCFVDSKGKVLNLKRVQPEICTRFQSEYYYAD